MNQLTPVDGVRYTRRPPGRPMPIRPCPICGTQTVRWLEASSTQAYVNYYRCEQCGNVWNVPKDRPQAEPHVVTRRVDDDASPSEQGE